DRLFPLDPKARDLARVLYKHIEGLPIISPHGHTDPSWYALNEPFPNPAQLFVCPDHYVLRMLYSQGLRLEDLGLAPADGSEFEQDGRAIWRRFAEHYHLFRGTPSKLWIDHALQDVFGWTTPLTAETADAAYDAVAEMLEQPSHRPRALYERFNIEAIATTESPLDDLRHHKAMGDWTGRVLTTYRPDEVVDPDNPDFAENLGRFAEITGEDTTTWAGYLAAHRTRRAAFQALGATATDHGHPSARTQALSQSQAAALFDKVLTGKGDAEDREVFRGQMLTEMARMSLEDGMVMQLHPGSHRNHAPYIFDRFGRDKGFDIPKPTEYVHALAPLLTEMGHDPRLTLILITLDETTYSRELAPRAGVYPCLRLGPP
ncbi:MAG: glucuronate isomerase, partial [Pseudomonadota bacterium]